ncbi:hypothetical protein PGT21_032152 [Puccinia graminis f. sp. tritici]|uniref:Uncharacterized protein n=1 Tax=Puccinia graminis f. sp. tritici TaxID=56615 RepID=A0A5B0PB43_PUCGR|nr:hypothetical protein PGT21_032855 [Puccinia graminis f. sp. tritici]KAA1101880.1 hypothetical protein PGT21_032152 [Puccinia graminis f. sp. tritici]
MNPTKDTMRLTMACALCNTTLNIPTFETHSWLDSRWGKLLARTFVLEGCNNDHSLPAGPICKSSSSAPHYITQCLPRPGRPSPP